MISCFEAKNEKELQSIEKEFSVSIKNSEKYFVLYDNVLTAFGSLRYNNGIVEICTLMSRSKNPQYFDFLLRTMLACFRDCEGIIVRIKDGFDVDLIALGFKKQGEYFLARTEEITFNSNCNKR